jgi:hypothetical protein
MKNAKPGRMWSGNPSTFMGSRSYGS